MALPRLRLFLAVSLVLVACPTSAEGPASLVVFDIDNRGARLNTRALDNLNEYLGAVFAEGGLRVLDRGRVSEALRKRKALRAPCQARTCQAEIAKQLSVEQFVSIQILKIGGACKVTGRWFVAGQDSPVGAAVADKGCDEQGVLGALELVAVQLLRPERSAPAEETTVDMNEVPRDPAVAGDPGKASVIDPDKGETGRLSLNSVPWGRVWIDGKDTGLTTPLIHHRLPAGRRQIMVRSPTGEELRAEVDVWSGESSTLILRSDKGGAADHKEAGWLSVNTRPWSEVTVDDKHIGMTPLRYRLRPGNHMVRLGFAHGETKTEEVVIRPGKTTRLVTRAATPEAFPFKEGMGLLKLHSSPWGRVWIDGKDSGKATPVFNLQLSAGNHRITIHFSTGGFMTEEVTIRAGETTRKIIRER